MWHLLKTTCYGPLAIHTICKYDFICATLYNFFVLVHNTSENTILFFFFWQLLICRGLYLNNVFFLLRRRRRKKKKEKKKKNDLLFPLHCDGELTQRLPETLSVGRRTTDSKTSGSLLADRRPRQTRGRWRGGRKRSPPGQPPPPNLWLTVAYFDPLSDE